MSETGASRPTDPRRIVHGLTRDELERFDATAGAIADELETLAAGRDRLAAREDGAGWAARLDAATAELQRARQHRQAFELEAAWVTLKACGRSLLAFRSRTELLSQARALRREAAAKLSGWRSEAVDDLLEPIIGAGDPDGDDGDEIAQDDLVDAVTMAHYLIDGQADNGYHKYRMLRKNVVRFCLFVVGALCGLIVVVASGWARSLDGSPLAGWRALVTVMALGALGAVLSAGLDLRRSDQQQLRIPEIRIYYTLMWMRPFVGAAGAVTVIVLLHSGLGDIITLNPDGQAAVAIAAGFTERLVTRTVASATGAVSG